ncbi:DUF3592 domain-containing protein [Hyalangium rubrum]|uniref:DUF3592 domain-containing protein n=1 Tax=Hyalangium rubrum TaxID=3103134 RepID=A0ABU5HJZ0_9BACT|nr:DUF3592 domain-containing protein [Hyalangium sp. s54d21]MDY7232405.1 DUF3592 domain-containing protein [Hyalangium sp. s54d21]
MTGGYLFSVASLETRFRITVVLAVCCLAIGGFDFLRTASFVLNAEQAHAVVVTASSRGSGQYRMFKGHPEVVEFSDLDGIVHTTTLYYGQPGRHPPGTTVEVLYKPYDPAGTARYRDSGQLWTLSGCLMLMGALFLAGALAVRKRGY